MKYLHVTELDETTQHLDQSNGEDDIDDYV